MSRTREGEMTVMGISGEIAVLRPEDKLIVRMPLVSQQMANQVNRHLRATFGDQRVVLLPQEADVTPVSPGKKVVIRIPGLTSEIAHAVSPKLVEVFGEDGFILLNDTAEVETDLDGKMVADVEGDPGEPSHT